MRAKAGKTSERGVVNYAAAGYAAAESSPQSQRGLAPKITPEKAKGPEP